MSDLPTGTVTFLFTDIEGSTRLWDEFPEAMQVALARHDTILREAIERNGGAVFKTIGDAFCAAFAVGSDALSAALEAQRTLITEAWKDGLTLRVRMALHVGTAEHRNGDYFGPSLNRVARLLAVGHGAQTLISNHARELIYEMLPADCALRDLGEHRLKDLQQPEHVWQMIHPGLPGEFPPLRSLNVQKHNLPVQMTSFIGREQEVADVNRQLSQARLLTLAGSGGCGKTRLALQVAAELLDGMSDGVWLIELAPISDPELVVQAVASILNVREEPGRSLTQTLTDFLKAKKILLVLDNCEHLLTACARMAETLLRSCPDIKIIASSREALGIYGERVFRVPSLSVPDPKHLPSLNMLMRFPSARLFLERAQAHKPDLEVKPSNAHALAQICYQLDGIPLALELAAARLRAMSLEQLAARLEDRFRLLTSSSRTALPRQQTLRAAIDWSFDLLSENERLLLLRISVFAGGWTLEAAEAICADAQVESFELLDLLSSLVDKSLVVYEEHSGHPRYHLLATVRQYSQERLIESKGMEALREQHQNYYYHLVLEPSSQTVGQSAENRPEHTKIEYDNIRSALDWTLLHKDADEAAEMCLALTDFWETHTLLREARDTLLRCLARQSEIKNPRKIALILTETGWFCQQRADYAEAAEYQQRCLEVCRQSGDLESEANALNNLALIAQSQGRVAEARSLFVDSLEIAVFLKDERKQANRLTNLGLLAIEEGDYKTAREHLDTARILHAHHQHAKGLATCLCNLGDMALRQGEGAAAEGFLRPCLDLFRELGHQRGLAYTLTNLAEATLLMRNYAAADQHIAEALSLCIEMETKELIPLLLELRAASHIAQDDVSATLFCLAVAHNLREHFLIPPTPEEKKRVEAIEAHMLEKLGQEILTLPSVAVDQFSLSGLVEEALNPSSP